MSSRRLLVALMAMALAVLAGCSEPSEPMTPTYKTKLSTDELKNSAFKPEFPLHYETFLRNNESQIMTEYGGSVPYNKNDNVNPLPEGYKHAQPYLKNLWLGYPFSYEYRAARGHTYAVKDILNIDRLNNYSEKAGLPSTCWNCKTPKMTEWVKEYGDSFWAKDFHEFRQKLDVDDHTIGCANCHEPQTMELRLYSVPLQDYLKSQGKEFKDLPRNEKRALVCGQCHVEYYFADKELGPAKKPIFPWANGFDPEDMFEYYKTHGNTTTKGFEGNFVDWVHPVSKTPMLKAQHPEYETWINGVHGSAGVSCADCHMAYTRLDGKKKMSNHHWTSPLKDPDLRACRQCHTDKTPDYLRQRVLFTQNKVWEQLMVAQDISVKAHEAIRMAAEYTGPKPADYDDLMIEARQMCRKGQFFWDLVSAENSVGFHNPTKALNTLAQSQQYSQKAVDVAIRAAAFTTAKDLDGDIHKIVPPILKHSRELQMDPAHMATHKWFKYIPLLPKAPRVWDGQTRLIPPPAPAAAPAS
ncbi:ammonia-forming cytochrome c nitrite reductase subunit c552 [Nitratidesulfovibrio termitidis]|uniref:ammonia-forming cytochrome c nitrite reductase subunit c552 n=1 Tax=Nitratidesulfovibrio termitidis TaxID=42252 RepID=UPI00040BCF9A|nr:ammonia-forming cytochrome c nitrite reductase subunit c552 [Nitratidesulfovibrio termitidis]